MAVINERRSLLSSQARIQVPWVNIKIGKYVFGAKNKKDPNKAKDDANFYVKNAHGDYDLYYPNYVQSLQVVKINGQVNQYSINLSYPITANDDPNFFEKVLSSVSKTRKIVFTYGDATQPNYVYKDEEAIITNVTSSFNLEGCSISYNISAVSSGNLAASGAYTFPSTTRRPSDVIKDLFKNKSYGLQDLFTGMSLSNLDDMVAGDDAPVALSTKTNISVLDYISYLVGCMLPAGCTEANRATDIYILTLHDDTIYDKMYNDTVSLGGPYFKVTKTSYDIAYSDAYEVDIGFNTSTIVTQFQIEQNNNYSIYYDYQSELNPEKYTRRLNKNGLWEDVYSPTSTSNNNQYKTRPEDITWWTKLTKFPIHASITVQGLLRPAHLMTYLRLNVIFPGGHKHISSGLYIVTSQRDTIDSNGYKTQLSLVRIDGDTQYENGVYGGTNSSNTSKIGTGVGYGGKAVSLTRN